MPNWVMNQVSIKASEEDLRALADKHIVDGRFDFSTIVPWNEELTAEEYHGTDEIVLRDGSVAYTGGAWYEWNIEHWGTKWNAHETYSALEDGYVSFQTAWSQPIAIMDALAQMYPNFDIEWRFVEEQGWGGVCYYENGVERRTQRRTWDIPTTHDERMEIFDYCYACEDGEEEDMEMYGCPSLVSI